MSSISSINSSISGSSMMNRSADLFKKLDSSGDGSIDFEEFKAGAPKDGKGGPQGLSQEDMFKQIDTNGDGKIDQTENTTFMKKMEAQRPSGPPPSGPPPSNGASSSSGTSSTQSLADLLKQIDTNGDSTISKDEQESFLKLMEERRSKQQSSIQSYADDGKGQGTTSSLFSVLV